ncbi:putative Ubiquitin Carboxyl-Terminal Hydrolase Faf-X [Manis pentadactyla]|nr:putative Ubiquitin Carboxyl-Terminal Hydrolase Faf-X [Manis pentadactyla]
MHMIRLRREFWFNSDVRSECAIQFHDYSEAIVVSMVIPGVSGYRLSFMFTARGMIDIEADGVGSGDINAG